MMTPAMRSERGQAVLEFALALPFLIAFIMFITDAGFFAYSYISVTNAVREGARCAAVGRGDTEIAKQVRATSGGLAIPGTISVSPSEADRGVIGSSVTVSAEFTYSWITPVNIIPGLSLLDRPFSKQVVMRMETNNVDPTKPC